MGVWRVQRVVRVEKVKRINELKAIIKDIMILVDKLNKTLPKSSLRAKKTAPIPVRNPILKKPVRKTPEVTNLEKELKQIESRLNLMI